MLDNLDILTIIGLVIISVSVLTGLAWLLNKLWNRNGNWQQMFCPEDRSTCHCTSCREEHESH